MEKMGADTAVGSLYFSKSRYGFSSTGSSTA